MALIPIDEIHALQIQAGALGRKAGHIFEDTITNEINNFQYPFHPSNTVNRNVFTGDPAKQLLTYICNSENINEVVKATAISTGALATSEEGKQWLTVNGVNVSRCKSDLVVSIKTNCGRNLTIGVSTKQCNNKNPTNAQLYFTTARGFANLLISNGIPVSQEAVLALRQFCGDFGYRPLDNPATHQNRTVDPRRFFWEEIDTQGRIELENIFTCQQDYVSRLLFQKAYLNDPFTPEYLLHKTKKSASWSSTEVAIYKIDELITLSKNYQQFTTKAYSVKKGSYRDPAGVTHLAPRFGIIQMQRGGQQQHPDQLQFNLEAGYFYKI